jgi:hypothetical protein
VNYFRLEKDSTNEKFEKECPRVLENMWTPAAAILQWTSYLLSKIFHSFQAAGGNASVRSGGVKEGQVQVEVCQHRITYTSAQQAAGCPPSCLNLTIAIHHSAVSVIN